MHEIEQLNGNAPRIKSNAQFQIITEHLREVITYPYLIYMPEKDRLLLLVNHYEQEIGAVTMSDDRGATWRELKDIGNAWAVDLTYLGEGKAVLKMADIAVEKGSDRSHGKRLHNYGQGPNLKYWFSNDFGETWGDAVPAQDIEDGAALEEDSLFLVDREPTSGKLLRLWATGKGAGKACLLRSSDDGGRTWSACREIAEWGWTGEIVLHRAANGDMVAACRLSLEQYLPKHMGIDHFAGFGTSVSKDDGKTWSELSMLYAWGRHQTSMVTLDNGDIVLTYVVRQGYVDTADGYPQFGIEAVVSYDHGRTWDLDHKYILAVWKGNRKGPDAWYASPQRTSTVLLPDGSLITVFGTGYRSSPPPPGAQNHIPQDIALVRWRPHNKELTADDTISSADFLSDTRNVFDPRTSKYAMTIVS